MPRYLLSSLAILLGIACCQPTPAQAGKLGPELQVNTTTALQQLNPAAASYSGGFVVVWQSGLHPGGNYDIFGQRYANNGTELGSQFRINGFKANHQVTPVVAGLGADGFVVAWASFLQDGSGYGIYAQRYDRDGVKLGGNFRINTVTVMNQHEPAIAALTGGGFVVVWKDEGQGFRIYGRRYDADGDPVGAEFRADTATISGERRAPAVAGLADDGFVVVWQAFEQEGAGNGYGIYAQRFNAAGAKAGPERHVNQVAASEQIDPAVAGLVGGGFVVTWTGPGAGSDVFLRRYLASGAPAGAQVVVNTTTISHQVQSSVAALANGGFVVVWYAWAGVDGGGLDINGQLFTSAGAPNGDEFLVNTHSPAADPGVQDAPAVARLGNGFVATWTSFGQDGDTEGIYAQRFNSTPP